MIKYTKIYTITWAMLSISYYLLIIIQVKS
jgi:hypothetical protein